MHVKLSIREWCKREKTPFINPDMCIQMKWSGREKMSWKLFLDNFYLKLDNVLCTHTHEQENWEKKVFINNGCDMIWLQVYSTAVQSSLYMWNKIYFIELLLHISLSLYHFFIQLTFRVRKYVAIWNMIRMVLLVEEWERERSLLQWFI